MYTHPGRMGLTLGNKEEKRFRRKKKREEKETIKKSKLKVREKSHFQGGSGFMLRDQQAEARLPDLSSLFFPGATLGTVGCFLQMRTQSSSWVDVIRFTFLSWGR